MSAAGPASPGATEPPVHPPPRPRPALRDRWVLPGLALLALLTVLVVLVYASQPQSAGEVGGRALVADRKSVV